MKPGRVPILNPIIVFLLLHLSLTSAGQVPQGRIVINEYMPWTDNNCSVTSEFVELMNFGPGPMNIGCYILTDGDYSITIPPNTILQPGQFYVIAGQDLIPKSCANIDSAIHASLNWNTCNCTSGPIPTTGDGLFTDGGSSNEQVVLLDPNLNVVDAVVRALPAEPSSSITTASINGGCASKTFNLDLMNVRYETLGMSTGRGNSFARKLDGDCGWVKDPQQSANATNNTSGVISNATYTLTVVKSMDCDTNHGVIDVYVSVTDSTQMFPMNYTIAYDANKDGVFDFSDQYSYGIDSTPPSITILGLPLGRYKITVASVNGCFLKTFDVTILKCSGVLNNRQLVYFKLAQKDERTRTLEWEINETELIQSIEVQKSTDGQYFTTSSRLNDLQLKGLRIFDQIVPAASGIHYYRLKIINKDGSVYYSNIISATEEDTRINKVWPNPGKDKINLQLSSEHNENAQFNIFNAAGSRVKTGNLKLQQGVNQFTVSIEQLPAGIYHLTVAAHGEDQPISVQFVKH